MTHLIDLLLLLETLHFTTLCQPHQLLPPQHAYQTNAKNEYKKGPNSAFEKVLEIYYTN